MITTLPRAKDYAMRNPTCETRHAKPDGGHTGAANFCEAPELWKTEGFAQSDLTARLLDIPNRCLDTRPDLHNCQKP
jgi:hypothetical protein